MFSFPRSFTCNPEGLEDIAVVADMKEATANASVLVRNLLELQREQCSRTVSAGTHVRVERRQYATANGVVDDDAAANGDDEESADQSEDFCLSTCVSCHHGCRHPL
jgi:UDP-N-acetylmuramyl pentapeptide synthase